MTVANQPHDTRKHAPAHGRGGVPRQKRCDICNVPSAKTFEIGGRRRDLCVWHQKKYGVGRFRPGALKQIEIFLHDDVMRRVERRMRQEGVSDPDVMFSALIERGLQNASEVTLP